MPVEYIPATQNFGCNQMTRSWEPVVQRCLFGFPDIIFAADASGRFTYLGPKAEDLFGVPISEVLGRTLWDFTVPEDEHNAKSLLSTPLYRTFDTTLQIQDAGGQSTYVRVRAKPFADGDDEVCGYRGLLLKCHVSTKLKEDLELARRSLASKTRTIKDLNEHVAQGEQYRAIATHMAEIAHELKQPPTIIGGFARRMADKLGSYEKLDPETKPECFNIIQRELSRLEEMLVGLIGITRRYTLHYEEVDPNQMINDVLKVTEERLKQKSLNIQDNLDQPIGTVYLDPHLFEHVIRNLVINAIEATPEQDDIAIRICLVGEPEEPESAVGFAAETVFEMEIRNSGAPIPRDKIEKIFEPFYTTKSRGSRIGLTLAQHIVREHHGSISAQSDESGTVFTVRIPVKPDKEAANDVSEIKAAP